MTEDDKDDVHRSYPYPWLVPDDLRRFQTVRFYMRKLICPHLQLTFKGKGLTHEDNIEVQGCMFSLRDDIGACPNLKADIQFIDESSFFVRPFPLSETDKEFMDELDGKTGVIGNIV